MLLADILEESARKGSDRVAVRFKGKAYTYEDVRQRVGRLTAAWVRLGVRPGDHVAVIAPNSLAFIETTFSCARLGAVCEAYNVRLAPRVIVELLKRSNAQVVVVTPEMQERLAGLWKDVGCPLTLVLLDDAAEGAEGVVGAAGEGASGAPAEGAAPGGAAGEGASDVAFEGALVQGVQAQHGYEGLLASAADAPLPEAVAVRPEDPVFMLYTSGTTGLPKGVVFSQEAMVNRAQADVEGMRFSRDDIMLFVLPFYHVTCVSVFAVLLVGAQMVIGQSNKAPDIVSYVNRYGVTRVGLVPYHMRTLAAYVEAEHVTVDTLKLVIYGAEPAGPALLSRCSALLECDFLQGYGMTETASSVTVLLPEHHKDPRLLETAGVPLPGVEIRIVDEEGRVCPPGTSGEVVVKTNTLMLGYWNDLDQTARVVKDGWYYTEDIGFVDEAGFLTLVDRKNNLVITGGENVYPLEVSRCIASLGACIADVAVTGVPDERWGESLVAFVVRAPGAAVTEEDIVAHCADELGHYKKPKRVVFVDDLQRKSSGKVPKERLDELVAAYVTGKDDHGRL